MHFVIAVICQCDPRIVTLFCESILVMWSSYQEYVGLVALLVVFTLTSTMETNFHRTFSKFYHKNSELILIYNVG